MPHLKHPVKGFIDQFFAGQKTHFPALFEERKAYNQLHDPARHMHTCKWAQQTVACCNAPGNGILERSHFNVAG